MELTRRDAVAALAALGVGGGAVGVYRQRNTTDGSESPELPDDEHVQEVMVALAEVLYPDEVEGTAAFVEAFVGPRLERPDHGEGIRQAVSTLEGQSRSWYGEAVAGLAPAKRDQLLRETGADTAEEDPEGTSAEQIRYYLVNELLLALYASPTGGELVGIENPQGHPGGTDTYQRGPR